MYLPRRELGSRPRAKIASVDPNWIGQAMGKYCKGDHVKIEIVNERSGESEWMWLLVERSDDDRRIVFGKLDSQPIVVTDMYLGQELAVSYANVREHRKFD
jgi:hypothetical protein